MDWSSKEAHIGSTHAIVRVSDTGKHPLGPSLAATIGTEEVEEDSSVERADSLLTEVIVVGINLMAAVVMRAVSGLLHQLRVVPGEFSKSGTCLFKVLIMERGH